MSISSGARSAGGAVGGAMGGQGSQLGGGSSGKTGLAGWWQGIVDNPWSVPLSALGFATDVVTEMIPATRLINRIVGKPSHYTKMASNYIGGSPEQAAAPIASQPAATNSFAPGGIIGALTKTAQQVESPETLAPGQTPYDSIPGLPGRIAQYGYNVRQRDPAAFDASLPGMLSSMNRGNAGQENNPIGSYLAMITAKNKENQALLDLMAKLKAIYGDQIKGG